MGDELLITTITLTTAVIGLTGAVVKLYLDTRKNKEMVNSLAKLVRIQEQQLEEYRKHASGSLNLQQAALLQRQKEHEWKVITDFFKGAAWAIDRIDEEED